MIVPPFIQLVAGTHILDALLIRTINNLLAGRVAQVRYILRTYPFISTLLLRKLASRQPAHRRNLCHQEAVAAERLRRHFFGVHAKAVNSGSHHHYARDAYHHSEDSQETTQLMHANRINREPCGSPDSIKGSQGIFRLFLQKDEAMPRLSPYLLSTHRAASSTVSSSKPATCKAHHSPQGTDTQGTPNTFHGRVFRNINNSVGRSFSG